ncbi:MAG TPA: hypothetical protein VLE93_03775 [Candidatus Saccharimonadales bacterium]|nr:hypothetical protein [Candidatus Saccharimonadales bacterium]
MINPTTLRRLSRLLSDRSTLNIVELAEYIDWERLEGALESAEKATDPIARWFELDNFSIYRDPQSEDNFKLIIGFLMAITEWPDEQSCDPKLSLGIVEKINDDYLPLLSSLDRQTFDEKVASNEELEKIGAFLRYIFLYDAIVDELENAVAAEKRQLESLLTGEKQTAEEQLINVIFGPSPAMLIDSIDKIIIAFRNPVIHS